ncbi:L,D-transpeptidase family protein [Methylobacterium sp. Leaf93]|uniref:L,D-transpeptidase family protein n=1 Tax=Methylobacterium sp. Leaf93 TaxID=1736249 RepID=UPI0006FBF45F|nr:L,D-transpeptidase family protein [Methylobacterium sp. Leaf93]KQP12432.1 peptidoglycan-binding protein [Methylobacterium sp. Leaf93]
MGASRSASVALAALMAGCVGYAVKAEPRLDPAPSVVQSAAAPSALPEQGQGDTVATGAISAPVSPSPDPAKPAAAGEAAQTPGGPPETGKAETTNAEAGSEPAGAVAAAPVPTDPMGAALAARLADPAPLLARLSTKDREAMQAFYGLGDFKPVWVVDGAFTPAAKAAASRLSLAAEDGLNVQAYPVPVIGTQGLTEAQTAEIELKLSAAIVLYAKDARGARINLSAISRLITPTLDIPGADAVLTRVASAGPQAGTVLQGYNPAQAGYLALKARLASLRTLHGAPMAASPVAIPAGPVLKVGMNDPRVPALRRHFGLPTRTAGTLDAASGEPDAFDANVSAAVAKFQRGRGLPATGTLTPQTVAALGRAESSSRVGDEEATVLVNMERWRWLPSDLGRDYVLVNIPEFRLRVVRNGTQRDETRVIVGKAETPTPVFSGMMEYAVVNPSWNVPPSILKNEFLPALARDPNYAARRGYEVVYRNGNISVRQPPGERNALGFIKFLFPNNHAVYLHDTPNRSLFSASQRAMSHGCVRVDDPFRFADSVLPEAWSSERLKKLIGKGERTIRLPEKLPVHLAYFTLDADERGSLRTFSDLYGHDARMKIALGLAPGSLLVAKAPVKAPAKVAARPATPAPSAAGASPQVRRAASHSAPSGANPVRAVRAPAARSAEAAPVDPWGPAPAPAPVSRGWW